MPKCDFNKVALLLHGCSPVNLWHIFRGHFIRTPVNDCFCIFLPNQGMLFIAAHKGGRNVSVRA